MTKEQIIENLIKELLIEKCGSTFLNYIGTDYLKDFILAIYLLVLLIDELKLIRLAEKKQLNYYILRICKNNAVNPNSEFWKLHKARYKLIYLEDNQNLLDLM